MSRHLSFALLASVLLGCAANPSPVPVEAAGSDLGALAGRWEGSYSSAQTGRSGSIVFTLEAGHDTATGDVLMIPSNSDRPLRPAGQDKIQPQQAAPMPSVLTIRFVRLQGDEVRGELLPYQAPDCDCMLETVFTGRLSGGRIEGTFTTYGERQPAPSTGHWQVRRKGG